MKVEIDKYLLDRIIAYLYRQPYQDVARLLNEIAKTSARLPEEPKKEDEKNNAEAGDSQVH